MPTSAAACEDSCGETPGVSRVSVDLDAGRARVEGKDLDPSRMTAALSQLGYRAEKE